MTGKLFLKYTNFRRLKVRAQIVKLTSISNSTVFYLTRKVENLIIVSDVYNLSKMYQLNLVYQKKVFKSRLEVFPEPRLICRSRLNRNFAKFPYFFSKCIFPKILIEAKYAIRLALICESKQ